MKRVSGSRSRYLQNAGILMARVVSSSNGTGNDCSPSRCHRTARRCSRASMSSRPRLSVPVVANSVRNDRNRSAGARRKESHGSITVTIAGGCHSAAVTSAVPDLEWPQIITSRGPGDSSGLGRASGSIVQLSSSRCHLR